MIVFFTKALPVVESGKEKEMNYSLILRENIPSLKGTAIYITAVSFYRLSVKSGTFFNFYMQNSKKVL